MFIKTPKRPYKLTIPKMPLASPQPRFLSIWILPKILLATHRNSRRFIFVTAGGLTLLSTMAGPVALMTVGSIASFMSWRIFKNTTQWMDFSTDKIVSLQQTRVDEQQQQKLRLDTIHVLKTFTYSERKKKKSGGKSMKLSDHSLVWGNVSKSDLTHLLNGSQQLSIHFAIFDHTRQPICHVKTVAHMDENNKMQIIKIILTSRDTRTTTIYI